MKCDFKSAVQAANSNAAKPNHCRVFLWHRPTRARYFDPDYFYPDYYAERIMNDDLPNAPRLCGVSQ